MANVYGGDEVGALVFDFGNFSTKVGYAGEDQPRADIRSVVSINDETGFIEQTNKRKYHVGTVSVEVPRSNKEIKSFIRDGIIVDWDLFEKMLDSIYADYIKSEPFQHPVVVSETVWNSKRSREQLAELMFEHYHIPAFYLAKNGMLASFSCGRSTALVLDSGANRTTAIPVLEGHVLMKNCVSTPYGGEYISRCCFDQLIKRKVEIVPSYMIKSKERVEAGEKSRWERRKLPENLTQSFNSYMLDKVITQFKHEVVKVYDVNYDSEDATKCYDPINYEFPDGFNLDISVDDQYTLVEPLFDTKFNQEQKNNNDVNNAELSSEAGPSNRETGVPSCTTTQAPNKSYADTILESIDKCDIDIRPALLNSIILVGGNTLIPGFTERITYDLNRLAPHNFKVKVVNNARMVERKFGTWIGGSILASLGTFQQLWISRQNYEEHGKTGLDFDAR